MRERLGGSAEERCGIFGFWVSRWAAGGGGGCVSACDARTWWAFPLYVLSILPGKRGRFLMRRIGGLRSGGCGFRRRAGFCRPKGAGGNGEGFCGSI